MKTTTFPSHVGETPIGLGLIAEETLEEDAIVEKLEGRIVPYAKIPENDIRNAFEVGDDRWIVPQSNARHLNHSCDPNCYISDNLDVVVLRKVYQGDELTVMYNEVTLETYMKTGSVLPGWDERRSFDCYCGTPKCIGRIDRYIVPLPGDPNIRAVRMGTIERRGRAMFASRKFLKGELIERAPVIPINQRQWPSAEKTILSDYAFDWGEHDEHAAIALGYVSIYNHSYEPNAQLEELLDELMMEVVAIRDIQPGEEITINYNGDPESQDPLWFIERAAVSKPRRTPRKRRV
jgi:SET domain-containing protein